MVRVCCLGEDHHAQLQVIANAELGNGDPVPLGHPLDGGVLFGLSVGHGGVGLQQDPAAPAEGEQGKGRVGDVTEHLVDHGLDRCRGPQILQVCRLKVGDPDGPDLSGGEGVLQGPPHLAVFREVAVVRLVYLRPGLWAVNEHQIHIVQPHGGQSLVDGLGGGGIGLVLGGHLAGDKNFFPGDAAAPDSLPNAGLVAVGLGGVDMAVADGERGFYRLGGLLVGKEPSAKGQPWDGDAVGQGVLF